MDDLLDRARQWMEDDPDPGTRAQLQDLIDRNETEELGERFSARLQFGTAGIRGAMGAGPGRMNVALVRKVTAGLADYLLASVPDVRGRGIVVGRDARHMSPQFENAARAVLAGAGIPVHVFSAPVPTPVCAYAVTALEAAAGIVITASHNPREDNGYKVYAANGAQIIPPADAEISRAIDGVGPVLSIPVMDGEEARHRNLLRDVPAEVEHAYLEAVAGLRRHPEITPKIRVVYTPLHGVGGAWVRNAFARAGFQDLHLVPEQLEPDGDFPTVEFPNPEEPGAMDLAIKQGLDLKADLILANDPDADRLAAVVPAPDGSFRALTGNDIGVILAHYLITQNPPSGKLLVMTTVVSSRLLEKMARELGTEYDETLTGFKWIATKAIDAKDSEGLQFVLGFEEALGYTVGDVVRDKDGIGSAVVFAEIAAWCREREVTLLDYLEEISRRFGIHATGQKSVVLPGKSGMDRMQEIMGRLRDRPLQAIGGVPVDFRADLLTGVRFSRENNESKVDFPRSNVLVFDLEDGSRVLARPSGTEPKIKFYFEVSAEVPAEMDFSEAESIQKERLARLEKDFIGAMKDIGASV